MAEFKVGDKVTEFYRNGFSHSTVPSRITTVVRVTKTKMVLADGTEWRSDGSRTFSRTIGYSYPRVELWIPAHSDAIASHNAKTKVSNFVAWDKLSEDQIKRVASVIDEWRESVKVTL